MTTKEQLQTNDNAQNPAQNSAKNAAQNIVPVILCGGSGTRLWPASRESYPKQFLKLMDRKSLLQNTILRAQRLGPAAAGDVVIVTLDSFAGEVAAQAAAIDPAATRHILTEPCARNTAAALAYAADYVRDVFGADAMMWVFPADHHIQDESALAQAGIAARAAAEDGLLVTFGITPTRAETGYGYIRPAATARGDAGVYAVEAFAEKPARALAESYVASGAYLWNSGMFTFTAGAVLAQYAAHAPDVLDTVRAARRGGKTDHSVDPAVYATVRSVAFDTAIMEKTAQAAVVPCDPAWSDIGSWGSLWDLRGKDANGIAAEGRVATAESKDCLVVSSGRLVACAGVENLVIVDTGDAVLVADRNNSDALKALVKTLKDKGFDEVGTFAALIDADALHHRGA